MKHTVYTCRKRSNNTYWVKIQEEATAGSYTMIDYSRFSQATFSSHSLWLQNQFSYRNKPNMAKKLLPYSLQLNLNTTMELNISHLQYRDIFLLGILHESVTNPKPSYPFFFYFLIHEPFTLKQQELCPNLHGYAQ